MKVEASSYEHDPSISLFIVPETDVEKILLRSLWKHGELSLCNGVADGTGLGFKIGYREIQKSVKQAPARILSEEE